MFPTRPWVRRFMRGGLFVVVMAVFCVLGALVFITTGTGRDAIARLAESALSDDAMTVKIDDPGGDLLSAFRIGRITLADGDGNVVMAEEARIDWRPASLLGGIVDVREIRVRRISADGFAAGAAAEEPSPPPALPPLSIRIAALTVDEVAFGPAVLGEAQRFSLSASASLDSNLSHAGIKARLARSDGAPGHADIDLDYAADPARFGARIDVQEPPGGPVARLAGLPSGAPLSVSLDGSGPPDGWRGRLAAGAGGEIDVTADIALAVREGGISLTVDGGAKLAALLPASAQAFAAPRVDLHAGIDYGADGTLSVTSLRASSKALTVEANGRYAPARDAVDAKLSAVLHDAAPVSALVPAMKLAGARLEATLDGTLARPTVDAHLGARGLSLDGAAATDGEGTIRLVATSADAFALSGTVRFAGLDTKALLPDGLLGTSLDLRFDGAVRRDGAVPRLALRASSGAATVEIDAASRGRDAATGRYRLRHGRIGTLAKAIGLPLQGGNLTTEGEFRTDLGNGASRVSVAGALGGLTSDAPWATATFGKRVGLSGMLQWDGDDTLAASDIDVASDTVRVRGNATIHPTAGRLVSDYAATLADLQPFSPVAGTSLRGALSLTGSATGPLASPALSGQLALRRLAVQDVALGNVAAGIAGRPNASGFDAALRLGGDIGGKALGGRASLSLAGDTVRLVGLDLAIGRNAIAGDLTVGLDGPRLAGQATASFADLADLPRIGGLPVPGGGKGALRARLRHDRVQEITLEAEVEDMATGGEDPDRLTATRATAALTLREPFGAISMDGKLRLAGLRAGGAALSDVALTASGALSALDWTATAAGEKPVPLSLAADGRLAVTGRRTIVTVNGFDGEIATHAVSLRAPATVEWSPGRLKAGPADLSAAGGRLRLSLAQDADSVEADGTVDGLPVALAAPFDARFDLAGTVSGTMRIAGSPRRPAVNVRLTAAGIRPRDIAKEIFAGLTVTAEATQDETALQGRLAIEGAEDMTATASLRTAPALSLAPFRVALPADRPIAGRIDASGNLALVDRIVGLGGDRLGGRIAAQAQLAGTVSRPELRGEATLADGAYEGMATGIVIRDAAASIAFNGDEARLVSLSAVDGGQGRISGSGALALAGGGPRTGDLSVTLHRFAALHHPTADIVASGTLTVKGPFDAPAIGGRLTVDRGEIRIPDRLPEDVVELDVVEINRPENGPAAKGKQKEASASQALPVALDVTIEFPGRTFVRGRGLDSEWKGNLALGGTTAKPAIAGKLSVVRGTFAFAGKTFRLKSGSVSFAGSDSVEPEIDAVAEASLTAIVARVHIAGKASSPSITVTSEPPLPQEEVLAQILFGRNTGQLTALQAAQLAQTAATLSGASGGVGVVDRVRQALGVDVLDVDAGDGRGASLKAGKYIAEDVFVSVTQGTEPGSQKVGVEVEVLPNLSLESDVSGASSGNVGVNWKFDY